MYKETLIARPANKKQLIGRKAIMKVLKVDFKAEKSLYVPDFVKKILESKKEILDGKGIRIKVEDLWKQRFPQGHLMTW